VILVDAYGSRSISPSEGIVVAKLPEGVLDNEGVVRLLRAAVKRTGSQRAFAARMGLERTHLNTVLNGKRPPSESIIKALNLRIVYVRK
jgi:DNA-binding phage protein